ncbi:uncharacterized protein A1O9_00935 [Exophiala aquamarina CBS 119918]|uniref:Uncharacterized protein n=1 Tax=Exophiala aquamarina CBS 119918 TaxID=1182545 RepID=A0A072Q4X0_9EURO|nr:uncharacterized protein A1O9_00935 [Exophiala aquamarina CBS 119918]KEF62960.1 hypothetical protein A1O9_00935 [Exophiala aquamarina CBS 119918]
MTANLKRALHIMRKAPHVLHLAIVDYNVVEKYLAERFGEHDKIWLVPTICEAYKLDDIQKIDCPQSSRSASKRRGYTGRDEFLIWASLPCEPVGILDKRSIIKLTRAMNRITELSYDKGTYLADYLNDIHYRYRAVFSYKLIRAFEVHGYHLGRNNWCFQDFLAGVYRDRTFESSISTQSTPTDTVSEAGWSDWSQSTSSISDHQNSPEDSRISQFTFSTIQRQQNLTIEIPPLRESLVREYENAAPTSSSVSATDNTQDLIDRQIANEASRFGILVGPSRGPSPASRIDDEGPTISDVFLRQLNEVASRDLTPTETHTASPMGSEVLHCACISKPKQKLHRSQSINKVSPTTSGRKLGVSKANKEAPTSRLEKPPVVDVTRERHRPRRRRRRSTFQQTTKTTTTLLGLNHEELKTTTTTQEQKDTSIDADSDDSIIIIGTAKRRHQTVLSIRSRSMSEAAAVIKKPKDKLARPLVTKSRIPPSNKKTPIP